MIKITLQIKGVKSTSETHLSQTVSCAKVHVYWTKSQSTWTEKRTSLFLEAGNGVKYTNGPRDEAINDFRLQDWLRVINL